MRHPTLLLRLCAGLILAGSLSRGSAAVTLDLSLAASNNLEAFFLEDLNITGQAPASEVFRVTLQSDLPATPCYFEFSMGASAGEVIHGRSNVFTLNPGTLLISSLDLTQPDSPYWLTDHDLAPEANGIQEQVETMGYFPADVYRLYLELHESGGALLAHDELIVTITNPFTTQLLSPFGTPGLPGTAAGSPPVFVWAGQAGSYLLRICEQTYPGQDPESALQGRPHYETDLSQPLTSQNFVYPPAGVRPLEPGRTYFWQVTALVETSSGSQSYPSAVGAFQIPAANADPQAQRILMAVQRILGPGRQGVLDELTGCLPDGGLRLNGRDISIEDLEALAAEFEQRRCRLAAVYAE